MIKTRPQRPLLPKEELLRRKLQTKASRDFRSLSEMAPHVVSTPTLPTDIAKCSHCASALIQNTGKGGRYRYQLASTV